MNSYSHRTVTRVTRMVGGHMPAVADSARGRLLTHACTHNHLPHMHATSPSALSPMLCPWPPHSPHPQASCALARTGPPANRSPSRSCSGAGTRWTALPQLTMRCAPSVWKPHALAPLQPHAHPACQHTGLLFFCACSGWGTLAPARSLVLPALLCPSLPLSISPSLLTFLFYQPSLFSRLLPSSSKPLR